MVLFTEGPCKTPLRCRIMFLKQSWHSSLGCPRHWFDDFSCCLFVFVSGWEGCLWRGPSPSSSQGPVLPYTKWSFNFLPDSSALRHLLNPMVLALIREHHCSSLNGRIFYRNAPRTDASCLDQGCVRWSKIFLPDQAILTWWRPPIVVQMHGLSAKWLCPAYSNPHLPFLVAPLRPWKKNISILWDLTAELT